MDRQTPLTGWQRVRLVGNLVNLTTPLGLGIALAGGARIRRGPRGHRRPDPAHRRLIGTSAVERARHRVFVVEVVVGIA